MEAIKKRYGLDHALFLPMSRAGDVWGGTRDDEKGNYGWPDGFEEHLLSPALSSIGNGGEGVAATRVVAQEVSLQVYRLEACPAALREK